MTGMTLYGLTDEYLSILDLANDPEADPESFDAALQAIAGELTEKAISVASVARNLDIFADQIDVATKAMQARARTARGNAERVRDYLLRNMQAAGIEKVESPYFAVAIRSNPPAVIIDEDADIPPDLCRVIPARTEPDKAKIKAALKAGEMVEGCRLERSERLEIK